MVDLVFFKFFSGRLVENGGALYSYGDVVNKDFVDTPVCLAACVSMDCRSLRGEPAISSREHATQYVLSLVNIICR